MEVVDEVGGDPQPGRHPATALAEAPAEAHPTPFASIWHARQHLLRERVFVRLGPAVALKEAAGTCTSVP